MATGIWLFLDWEYGIWVPAWNRIETLFHEGKRINHKSYLTYGPRTILIFTGIKSIKDYDYLHMRKK